VGTNGLATALTLGTTNIGATLTGVVAPSVPLTVSAATLVSIQVSPANAAIAKGSTQQFFAIGLYTDGTQVDLTSAVTWQSSVGTVASVSNAAGSNGLASASAIGSTTITASFDGVASPGANLSVSASLEPFAAVWRYGPIAGNQATLIMDASGNLTVFGLWNGAWFGYNGTVQASGSIVSGTLIYNTGQGTCESCADQDPTTGLQPLANVTLTVDNSTGTLVFTDNTNSQTLTYFYADPSTLSPLTDLTAAQASWTTLVSGGEPSYPHYGGWGNPYPVSAVGYGGLGDCLNSGTISADIPALGIYTLTCTQAYDAAHGIGVFNPSTVVVATGLVFMNTSGQIFGAMSDEGLFENVSYPAGVFP
jgi:hypothetical protein